MGPLKKLKQALNNWLARLAEANEKEFHGSAPNCCSLNRSGGARRSSYVQRKN